MTVVAGATAVRQRSRVGFSGGRAAAERPIWATVTGAEWSGVANEATSGSSEIRNSDSRFEVGRWPTRRSDSPCGLRPRLPSTTRRRADERRDGARTRARTRRRCPSGGGVGRPVRGVAWRGVARRNRDFVEAGQFATSSSLVRFASLRDYDDDVDVEYNKQKYDARASKFTRVRVPILPYPTYLMRYTSSRIVRINNIRVIK